jgi:acetyl-CoA acetyltransferase
VLEGEALSWPLTRPMVAARRSGAAAVVLASERTGAGIDARAPRIRASVLLSASADVAHADRARAADLLYRAAGIGPQDIDCAEVHDETPAAELDACEALQFAPVGHAPELVDSGFTELRGVLPVNASGGLLAGGERNGTSGVAQVAELVRQLRGEAGRRQISGAQIGLAHAEGPDEDGERRIVAMTAVSAS